MSEHLRNQAVTFMLSEEEHKLISNYLSKYNISNRSRWCREVIISHILKMLDVDHPTLFSENEMRR